jgi:hypothetical protein
MNITLTQEDIMRLEVIDLDRDAEEALKFIRGRLLPEIKRQQGMKMQGHLDGGKGSAF